MVSRTDKYSATLDEIIIEEGLNCREDYGDLDELAEDIAANGVLVPVQVYQKKLDKKFTLLDGHRRVAATKLAGEKGLIDVTTFKVPMNLLRPMSEVDKILVQNTFNSGKSLNMLEEAKSYQRAINHGADVAYISDKVKKSAAHVNNLLLLLTAGMPTKKLITEGVVAPTLVITLLKKSEPSQVDAELKEAVRAKKDAKRGPQLVLQPERVSDNDDIPRHEDNMVYVGKSGMELDEDSGPAVKITAKSLTKDPKEKKYTKKYILDLLREGNFDDSPEYVYLFDNLED